MGLQVSTGAVMMCTFGVAPSTLNILPTNKVMATTPAANIMDTIPMVNIPPFGMCDSMSNPQVTAAAAAALGVLTPMPCVPVPAGPWVPGKPTVLIGNMPAIDNTCMLTCAYGGVITITAPGQTAAVLS